MSHNPEAAIVCPNCGYHAVYNYCAQCGQETHLHKETFIGLVVHFVAHYFHYDSKFWKTIKTLITKPGQLTVAYWNKQRARYIPPISLYVFISTIYFIVSVFTMPAAMHRVEEAMMTYDFSAIPALKESGVNNKELVAEMQRKMVDVQTAMHHLPKVFFFLVPFFALLQKLFFIRRKDLFFVDHAVYSLHFHSLCFIVFLLQALFNSLLFTPLTGFVCFLFFFIYSIQALRYVYKISVGKAIGYSLLSGIIYLMIFGFSTSLIMLYYTGAILTH